MISQSTHTASLDGASVLITGGSTGIGFATAQLFAQQGAQVAVLANDGAQVASAVERLAEFGTECLGITADVTNEEEMSAAVDRTCETFDGLTYAFNCAGVPQAHATIAAQRAEEFDRIMTINAKGTWLSMKFEIPAIVASGGGAIVNAASAAGLKGFPGQAIYAAAKHAVVGLTKSIALDYAAQGIRVNAIAPGVVNTEMIRKFARENPETWDDVLARRPMETVADPSEVAAAVLFLCTHATNTTGAVLPIDGGLLA